MYAVVTTGGKQYRVKQGLVIRVARIEAPVGDTVELGSVSLLAKDDALIVDPKSLGGAKVVCEILGHDREKKIRVFKKKRRKNYMRTYGHRQDYTSLRVSEIVG